MNKKDNGLMNIREIYGLECSHVLGQVDRQDKWAFMPMYICIV